MRRWLAALAAVGILIFAPPTRPAQAALTTPTFVLTWGDNNYGLQADGRLDDHRSPGFAPGVPPVRSVAISRHVLAAADDGTVWAWGLNRTHELAGPDGDESTALGYQGYRSAPQPISHPELHDIIQVAVPAEASLALRRDGTVWGWGANSGGAIATDYGAEEPVQQFGAFTDITAIAASGGHSLLLRRDGTVLAAGDNQFAVLGNGTQGGDTRASGPVTVSGLHDVTAIAAGGRFNLAVENDGSVWAWGSNDRGQLGDGTATTRTQPVRLTALSHVVAVAASNDYTVAGEHGLAVESDGSVWAWGANDQGQLGDGTTSDRSRPTRVVGLGPAQAVAAGLDHSVALLRDGSVWAWGAGASGQLGDGRTLNRPTPVAVGLGRATAVVAGEHVSAALAESQAVGPMPSAITFQGQQLQPQGVGTHVLTQGSPARTQPGDLLLAQVGSRNDGSPLTPPAGWQVAARGQSGPVVEAVFWRIAQPNDRRSWDFSLGTGTVGAAVMATYSGLDPDDPIGATSTTSTSAQTKQRALSVSTTRVESTAVAVYATPQNDSVGDPFPWVAEFVPGGGGTLAAQDIRRADVGPTGDYLLDTGASSSSVGHMVVLNPAPASAQPHPAIDGYRLVASDGGVFAYGTSGFFGSAGGARLNQPVVGIASTPDGRGYWLVASDGGVFNYGDAGFFGSAGGVRLNRPVVGLAAAPDGKGYWLVASDGGVFAYGSARFFGSAGGIRLNRPVVGIAAAPDGKGYWLAASDGGVFNYGSARFFGSAGGARLNQPVVGIAPMPDGGGYWLAASDGGIFNYGSAGFFGSAGGLKLNKPVVGVASASEGRGYRLAASDGGVFDYGSAGFEGSAGAVKLNRPVVGLG